MCRIILILYHEGRFVYYKAKAYVTTGIAGSIFAIKKIDEFISIYSTELRFVILSPIEVKYMIPITEKIQEEFDKFNSKHGRSFSIDLAVCFKEDDVDIDRLPKYILPMLDGIFKGKEHAVTYYIDTIQRSYNVKNTLYFGNGRNDIEAMKYLREKFAPNAFIICPKNSRTVLRNNPNYITGDGPDLTGINSGLGGLIEKIKKPVPGEDDTER